MAYGSKPHRDERKKHLDVSRREGLNRSEFAKELVTLAPLHRMTGRLPENAKHASPQRKTQVVAALLAVALPLVGLSIINRLPEDQAVEMASLVVMEPMLNLHHDNRLDLRRDESRLSYNPVRYSTVHRKNVEKLPQAMPVPAYLIQSASAAKTYRTEAAFVSKGALVPVWRTTSASNVVERYQLYLGRYSTGFADADSHTKREVRQKPKLASANTVQRRKTKAKNIQSTSKLTKPPVAVKSAVPLSANEHSIQCGNKNNCRQALQTAAKDCDQGRGLSPDGLCVLRNYRNSSIIKR